MTTVIPTDALTTLAKVKDYLDIPQSDISHDAIINALITTCTAFIKSFCGGREFLAQDFIEIYDSYRGRRKIFMRQYPVNSVSAVEYRSGTPSNTIWVTYQPDGYLKYLSQGYLHFYAQLPEISQGIRISYNAGFLIDFTNEFDKTKHTLPQDLTLVATEIIAKQYNTRKSAGVLQESTEGQSISYSYKARELDDMHRNILANYKQFRIAS